MSMTLEEKERYLRQYSKKERCERILELGLAREECKFFPPKLIMEIRKKEELKRFAAFKAFVQFNRCH